MPENTIEIMPKQVSALNTFWLITYLRENHTGVSPEGLVAMVNRKNKYHVENLKTGKVEQVGIEHLMDTDYWFSNAFMIDLYNEIQSHIPDPELAYQMGRTSYRAQHILKTALAVPLLGPRGVLKRIVKENSKYNRTKDVVVLTAGQGHVVIRLAHYTNIKITRFAMEWHRGVFETYARLAGARDTNIKVHYIDEQNGIVDFEITFKEPSFLSRLQQIVLSNIPMVRHALEQADQIQLDHKQQILNRERIIEERTRELKQTQAQLIEAEKRFLEHRITGGFAHEMRNALGGAQLEFRSILDYRGEGKAAHKVLEDAAVSLIEKVVRIHDKYKIPREEIAKALIPEIRTIVGVAADLSEVHEGISRDIDRGLSITNQIREYAKLSELKPGGTPVDLVPLLKAFASRYRQDFERIGIKYSVEGVEGAIIKADEIHMDSIFSNLISNARDALQEKGTGDGEIRVTVDGAEEDGSPIIIVKVEDNGPGIPKEHMSEIFEPFFSTKTSSGTGLGLGIVKRLVQLYGGSVAVNSKQNERTYFILRLPL